MFNNAGSFNKTGTGTTQFTTYNTAPAFNNTGTMQANAGTLSLSTFALNAGVMLAGGGGTVAINGALEAGAGTVSIDFGGLAANQYGHLGVTGAATLRAGRSISRPPAGSIRRSGRPSPFLTCASRTGQFAIVNGKHRHRQQFTVFSDAERPMPMTTHSSTRNGLAVSCSRESNH